VFTIVFIRLDFDFGLTIKGFRGSFKEVLRKGEGGSGEDMLVAPRKWLIIVFDLTPANCI